MTDTVALTTAEAVELARHLLGDPDQTRRALLLQFECSPTDAEPELLRGWVRRAQLVRLLEFCAALPIETLSPAPEPAVVEPVAAPPVPKSPIGPFLRGLLVQAVNQYDVRSPGDPVRAKINERIWAIHDCLTALYQVEPAENIAAGVASKVRPTREMVRRTAAYLGREKARRVGIDPDHIGVRR